MINFVNIKKPAYLTLKEYERYITLEENINIDDVSTGGNTLINVDNIDFITHRKDDNYVQYYMKSTKQFTDYSEDDIVDSLIAEIFDNSEQAAERYKSLCYQLANPNITIDTIKENCVYNN